MSTEAQVILTQLQSLENKANQEGMKRFAVGYGNTLGIKIPVLRDLAREYKKHPHRHQIALSLWRSHIHEAMILASMIEDPAQVSEQQMDAWTIDFQSWDLCDQTCGNLFHKTPFFLEKAFEYSFRNEEFVKRTGFVLMVQYTLHHKKADDALCLQFLQRIEEEAGDDRNFVKKALNWCLRQIGKRNRTLYARAVETAERIRLQPSASARWIAADALRELQQSSLIARLK